MVRANKTLKPYLGDLIVQNPIGHLNLTLVPVEGDGDEHQEYLLSSEALERGLLTITEVGEEGSVPELKVKSTSEMMILLLDGEELVGAKQNRIVNTTILLPAKADMTIPVSCVEQGRWHDISKLFQSGNCAPPLLRAIKSKSVIHSMRSSGRFTSDQSKVWEEILSSAESVGVSSPTMAMRDVVEQRRDSIDAYVDALNYPEGSQGVVVAINGKFVALDVFDNASTLSTVWKRLITGYAVDAMTYRKEGNQVFNAQSAKSLLYLFLDIECEIFPSIGIGEEWRFETDEFLGQALLANERCIHLAVFPGQEIDRNTEREPRIMSPSHRRDSNRERF